MELDSKKRWCKIVSELIVNVGTVLTGIGTWFTNILTLIETALETSVLLQILFGVAGAGIAFWLIKTVFRVVRSIRAGK